MKEKVQEALETLVQEIIKAYEEPGPDEEVKREP